MNSFDTTSCSILCSARIALTPPLKGGVLASICLLFLVVLPTGFCLPLGHNPSSQSSSMVQLRVGDLAPAFSAHDQKGDTHTLAQYAGRWVALYFYPRDNSTGCTQQACNLRDNMAELQKYNIVVLGVSADGQKSHQSFSHKYDLPFPLLVDEDKKILNDYGVWAQKKFMGKTHMGVLRVTFLIDPSQKIAHVFTKPNTADHVNEIISTYKVIKAGHS